MEQNLALTYAAGNKYLKRRFVQNAYRDEQQYGQDPLYMDLLKQPKSGHFPGEDIAYPIKVARTSHVSSSFTTAQDRAKKNTGKRERFVVGFDADFHDVARVSSKAIGASKQEAGAFCDLLDDEVGDVWASLQGAVQGALFRDKTYELGRTGTNTGVDNAKKEVTLTSDSALQEIEAGMFVSAAYSDDDDSAIASGPYEVQKVDRIGRKLILDKVTGIPNAAGKAVVLSYEGSAGVTGWDSIEKWIPGHNASGLGTVFNGMDRSVDPLRLAGYGYTAKSSDTIVKALQKAAVGLFSVFRGYKTKLPKVIDAFYVHPVVHQILTDELDDKVRYNKADGLSKSDARSAGFSDIGIFASGVFIPVKSSPNQRLTRAYGLNLRTWALNWIGTGVKQEGPVHLFPCPEGGYLKTAHDGAGVEARVQAYPTLGNFAPGLNVNVNLAAIAKIGTYLS